MQESLPSISAAPTAWAGSAVPVADAAEFCDAPGRELGEQGDARSQRAVQGLHRLDHPGPDLLALLGLGQLGQQDPRSRLATQHGSQTQEPAGTAIRLHRATARDCCRRSGRVVSLMSDGVLAEEIDGWAGHVRNDDHSGVPA